MQLNEILLLTYCWFIFNLFVPGMWSQSWRLGLETH